MKFMKNYTLEQNQVFRIDEEGNFTPIDLLATSIKDRANIVLYAIYHLIPAFDTLYLDDDIELSDGSITDSLITMEMLEETATILASYGVYAYPVEHIFATEQSKWLFITEGNIKKLLRCSSLEEYLEDSHYEFSEFPNFTHIYIDYHFTSSNVEQICGYLKQIKCIQGCTDLAVVNPALLLAFERSRSLLGMDDTSFEDCVILDGYTKVGHYNPILDLCYIADGSAIPFQEIKELYNYLCNLHESTIVLSAENTSRETNSTVKFSMIGNFMISDALIYLLALVHINTGKDIEFIRYASGYETRYLEAVSDIFHCSFGMFHERLKAFEDIREGDLFFIQRSGKTHICTLNTKIGNLHYKVCKLDDILSRIRYVQSKSTIAFDRAVSEQVESGKLRVWKPVVATREYAIRTSADNASCQVFSEDDLPFSSVHVDDIVKISVAHICQDLGLREGEITQTIIESFLFRVLRLLEQELFAYKRLLNITDLICFEAEGQHYIGCADFAPEYQVTGYYGCHAHGTAYFSTNVDRLIPASVLMSGGWEDTFFAYLLSKVGKDKISKCKPLVDMDTKYMLLSLTSNTLCPIETTTKDTIECDAGYEYSPYALTYIATRKLSTYMTRKNSWGVLSKYFRPYGMRDIPISRTPVNIYGGIASTEIYPVTMTDYCEGEKS